VTNALNPENSQREQRERQKSWLTLGLLWALLLVLAALRPLAVPDEGRYGEVGRWMLQSGDWLTPRLNGIPFFHKPPLLYWLQAMSLATFGVNAWALRLVPALHAGLMLAALYLAGRTVATEQIARRAAIMLGTSLTVLVGGQYINHDMLVATWIGVAIWCFAFSFMAGERPHAGLARWGFVACALGMLSKGLIGFALPGLVLFVWLLWTRQFRKVLHLPWLSGLALFAAIVVPWFAMAQHKYPEFLDYMFVRHQFQRYTATTFNNPQPWWLYLLAIGLLFFPWVLFALAQIRKPARLVLSHGAVAREWTSLCWIWVIAITVWATSCRSSRRWRCWPRWAGSASWRIARTLANCLPRCVFSIQALQPRLSSAWAASPPNRARRTFPRCWPARPGQATPFIPWGAIPTTCRFMRSCPSRWSR
jgi:4-amino-4-deoxy-L-arabinose transferase-like glycosyltransferase